MISIALMLIFTTIFFLGDVAGLFRPRVELTAKIRNVNGLTSGAPVWLLGVPVGSVASVGLGREGSIVTFYVQKSDLQYIYENARATVRTLGLLGEKYLEINPGSPEAGVIEPGAVIPGSTTIGFEEVVATSMRSITQVERFIKRLEMLIAKIESGEGTIAKLIESPTLYENLNQLLQNVTEITKRIEEAQGTVGLMIKDPSLYNEMLSATSSLDKFADDLGQGSGSLKKFITDPNLYKNLNQSADRLARLLRQIQKGKGLAGTLLENEALAQDFKQILADVQELIADMKKNPKKYFSIKIF